MMDFIVSELLCLLGKVIWLNQQVYSVYAVLIAL